ncbi:hypothetical protein AAE478_003265 [Parahypoxylon ruwenzoriense]
MAKVQRTNYLPYIQQYIDTQNDLDTEDEDGVALEVVCGICLERKLDISKSARELISSTGELLTEHLETHRHLPTYIKHGLERTVALPCGHVFGDRCMTSLLAEGVDLNCPSCGFKLKYQACKHTIPPALVPVDDHGPARDRFPLTIPEGGNDPRNCLECRWKMIRSNLRYALAEECVLCRQRSEARMPVDASAHRTHRDRYISYGLREALKHIAMLVFPEFVTRETDTSSDKATADEERIQIHISLLNAMVLSELDDTIWYRTKANNLSKEQVIRHARGVASIEQALLSWLMNSTRGSRGSRRMW